MCDKVRFTYLVDMSSIAHATFNVLEIHAATCQDDTTKEFVGIFRRYLIPHVFNDLIDTSFYNLNELTTVNRAFSVDRIL